jgi:hypothetical protein
MAQNIVGSKMPDSVAEQMTPPADHKKTGYGANGYRGASSDTDLSNPTRSAMAVALDPNLGVVQGAPLTRDLPPGNVPDAYGMGQNRARQSGGVGKLPGAVLPPNGRPVKR